MIGAIGTTRLCILGGALLFLICRPQMGFAADETITQMSEWHFETSPTGGKQTFTFDRPFGAVPKLLARGCYQTQKPGSPWECDQSSECSTDDAPVCHPGVFTISATPNDYTIEAYGHGYQQTNKGAVIAVGSNLLKGTATPKYAILTLIYAPPGTNGGHATSSVTYGSGTTGGKTTSASQTFQNGIGVSVTAEGGFLGATGQGSLSFDYSNKTTDTQSLEIKLSSTSTITRPGPGKDGIDHNEDAIYLILKPELRLFLTSSAAAWTFGNNTTAPIQYVLVGELNGCINWRPGVLQQLVATGITAADYPALLASDPFAAGLAPPSCLSTKTVLDPARFTSVNTMFPYEAPATINDPVIPVTTTISSSSSTTTGSAIQNSYSVGMSLSQGVGFLDFAKTTLKVTDNWNWTDIASTSTSSGTTQSASLTIGGPAYGYPGVTEVAVYIDKIYNTFAFVLVPPVNLEASVKGVVKTKGGAPIAGTEVTLTEKGNNLEHRTFTNSRGEYVFYGPAPGPAKVVAGGTTQEVPQAQPQREVNFVKP
jgi:hypothetical protein